MKILHIVGNRPQFIKLALLYKALEQKNGPGLIIHTGQHFDANMSYVFFKELSIPSPDHQLNINLLPHNEMIGNMLIRLDPLLVQENPDMVVVYGDTNTTLAGALAARKRNLPIAHIEAGIRTGDESMPEEANRYLTDRMARINFCCTYLGEENLLKEGFRDGSIPSLVFNAGDLMLDAAMQYQASALVRPITDLGIDQARPFILATIHRAENTGDIERLQEIIRALNKLHQNTPVIFPMHPNTRQVISKHQLQIDFATCEPLGYLDNLALIQRSQCIITDSGGLSREGFFFRKPSLVIMEKPFWPELFLHGNCLQSNANQQKIIQGIQHLLEKNKPFKSDIFGDGHAAEKISDKILAAG
jgi:UDP-GlcNAc3NAcA epimerase